jgi:hypothetical protein
VEFKILFFEITFDFIYLCYCSSKTMCNKTTKKVGLVYLMTGIWEKKKADVD